MISRPRSLHLAAGVALLAAIGCGDDDPVAPVAVLPVSAARLEAVAISLEAVSHQPVLGTLLRFDMYRGLPIEGLGGPFVGTGVRTTRVTDGALRDGGASPRIAHQFTSPNPFSIPDSLRGRTYVPADMFSIDWELDTLPDGRPRPGAPANGVRFVLMNLATSSESRERVGHMDVTQVGTAMFVDVYDLAGTRVLHHGGAFIAAPRTGWTALGATRVNQTAISDRDGSRSTWTGAGIELAAQRRERATSLDDRVLLTAIEVDGVDLSIEAKDHFTETEISSTYTVWVDGAPFARIVEGFTGSGTWQHLAEERPLNAGELAQVRALVRALAAIPSADAAWQRGVFNVFFLQFGGVDF